MYDCLLMNNNIMFVSNYISQFNVNISKINVRKNNAFDLFIIYIYISTPYKLELLIIYGSKNDRISFLETTFAYS